MAYYRSGVAKGWTTERREQSFLMWTPIAPLIFSSEHSGFDARQEVV
jgi:hypothetical protein